MNAALESALAYAARGWRVLPLNGKIPLTEHGSHDASTDRTVIQRWWTAHQDAAVGIATGRESGLWVLDADGQEGRSSLADLSPPIDTPWVATGGGGIHVYFAWDDRVAQRARFSPGLDTRGEGGYVVAPPSLHASGKRYEWMHGLGPERMPLLPAPDRIVALVAREERPRSTEAPRPLSAGGVTNYGRAALDANYRMLATTARGSRDDLRNTLAFSNGRLVAGGHASRDDAIECIVAACAHNGLLDEEGETQIRKRTERAVDDGFEAGPRGPVPQ